MFINCSSISLCHCIISLGKDKPKHMKVMLVVNNGLASITYKDDKVLKQSTINTIKYDDLGMDKDEAKSYSPNLKVFSKTLKA